MYSEIIEPAAYNHMMSKEHLYIAAADNFLMEVLKDKTEGLVSAEVVDIGCGPARVLMLASKLKNIKLTGIDKDPKFVTYAKTCVDVSCVNIILADIELYRHKNPVTIFYSQGMHHHISKGQPTERYLKNVYQQLIPGGYYILSDEFIPNYKNQKERETALAIWYSHIISHAIKFGFNYLAEEEAKTFLDDLREGRGGQFCNYKSEEEIKLVLSMCCSINAAAESGSLQDAKKISAMMLNELVFKNIPSGNNSYDLSRRDYKTSDTVLRREAEEAGFFIESSRSFGPIKTIGAMSVYILKKIA